MMEVQIEDYGAEHTTPDCSQLIPKIEVMVFDLSIIESTKNLNKMISSKKMDDCTKQAKQVDDCTKQATMNTVSK